MAPGSDPVDGSVKAKLPTASPCTNWGRLFLLLFFRSKIINRTGAKTVDGDMPSHGTVDTGKLFNHHLQSSR